MSILGHGQGGSDISSLLDAFNELHRLYRLEGRQYRPERWRVGCYPRCYPSGLDAASAADQYPTGNPLASYQHHPCENSRIWRGRQSQSPLARAKPAIVKASRCRLLRPIPDRPDPFRLRQCSHSTSRRRARKCCFFHSIVRLGLQMQYFFMGESGQSSTSVNQCSHVSIQSKARRQIPPPAVARRNRTRSSLPQAGLVNAQELNKPLFGNAFCPLLGRKGASERLSSFSRKVGGI